MSPRITHLPYPPPYQDLATLSEHLCVTEHTIETWVKLGRFPHPKRIAGGKRLWSWKEVERFMEMDTIGGGGDGGRQQGDIREAARRLSKAG